MQALRPQMDTQGSEAAGEMPWMPKSKLGQEGERSQAPRQRRGEEIVSAITCAHEVILGGDCEDCLPLVTCGMCDGDAFRAEHLTDAEGEPIHKCPHCGYESDSCDFPDSKSK